jgi:hypothetical protein
MADFPGPSCRARDGRIAELEARIAELDRYQRETVYLRDEAKAERDLRMLTGESRAMKAGGSRVTVLRNTGEGKEGLRST